MFSACSVCRRRLAKRAEGVLPRTQWARLEVHLSGCRSCRRIDEADRAMHMILSRAHVLTRPAHLAYEAADAFDDRVLNLVLNQPRSWWQDWFDDVRLRFRIWKRNASSAFLTQAVGGALIAAAVTAACLIVAMRPALLHSTTYSTYNSTAINQPILSSNAPLGPAVPLEALLNASAPRAAILWDRATSKYKSRSKSNINDAPQSVNAVTQSKSSLSSQSNQ